MQDASICILGACRNCEPFLPAIFENFNSISSWFKKTKIILYENESTDGTKKLLSEWMASSKLDIRLIQETNLGKNYPIRTERIAYIRNLLIDAVPRDFNYFFMVDLDDVFSPKVKKESFESCFRYTGWDVMTAYSVKYGYYDAWALRIPGLLEEDCWNIIFAYHEKGINIKDDFLANINSFMTSLKEPFPVSSAFNVGMLAKVSILKPCCRYRGEKTCEHVAFQDCLRSHGAAIFYNPAFQL
jgi:hypothetical protein